MTLKKQFLDVFNTLIFSNKKIVIVSHVNPDGDAVGSSLGLGHFLSKLGNEVHVMVPNDYPSFLNWLPGIEDIIIFDKKPVEAREKLSNADLICFLDFNNPSRSGLMHNDLYASKAKKILIDHHRDADFKMYETYLSEPNISSTSELVAEIIDYYGFEQYLNTQIADNLLVGIMTDTGSFSHSIYHPDTFNICGKLIEKSSNYATLHQKVYDNFSEDRLRLLGYAISNKMTVLEEYATAFIALNKEDLDRFNYQIGDTEGIVNYPLSLGKVKMSVLITERQTDVIRFSFRSQGSFSVHELAKKYFYGGGHTNAAGGTLNCHFDLALNKLIEVLPEYKALLRAEL